DLVSDLVKFLRSQISNLNTIVFIFGFEQGQTLPQSLPNSPFFFVHFCPYGQKWKGGKLPRNKLPAGADFSELKSERSAPC
ncbi:hypothetical protein J7J37_00555, partial [bacterium]|nr:hypothetical protein [bacterium]